MATDLQGWARYVHGLLPSDRAAEQAVLGAVLIRPSIAGWLNLEPEAFYDPKNRAVWVAMRELAGGGSGIDVVTLQAKLWEQSKLDAAGGAAYLGELALAVPTAGNVEYYAGIVRRHWLSRGALRAVADVEAMLAAGEGGIELVGELMARLARLDAGGSGETWVTLADSIRQVQAGLREPDAPKELLETGIPGIRVPVGTTAVLGALPGFGKTAFLLAACRGVARTTGDHVGVVLYEDRHLTLGRRALADIADVDGSLIRSRELELFDMEALMRAHPRPEDERVHIRHAHGRRMHWSLREASALIHEHKVRMLVLDYIQRVPAPERRLKRDEAVQLNCYAFDAFVAQHGLAGLLASQLNQDVEREGSGGRPREPRMSDLLYSSAIWQVVKMGLFLHPLGEDRLRVLLKKNNEGASEGAIDLVFDKPHQRFYELPESEPQPVHGGTRDESFP